MQLSHDFIATKTCPTYYQGWKPKPTPENPVLMEIFETQTETDTYSATFLKI